MPRPFTHPGWIALLAVLPPCLLPAQRDLVGYPQLLARLGGATPTGADMIVQQVEASEVESESGPWRYAPNPGAAFLAGKTIHDDTANSTPEPSGHATEVARLAWGSADALAPGVPTLRVRYAGDWLGSGGLRINSSAPLTAPGPVQAHAWIADLGSLNAQALRRIDLLVNRDGTLPVVGLNNSSSTTVPPLLASAYHVLTVGRSDGSHSRGGTLVEGAGRLKPDLVAPAGATSWATGVVAGGVALLVEAGRGLGDSTAVRPETLKAVLLASANRAPFPSWSRATDRPFDPVYGAGQLDIDLAHRVLTAGRQPPSGTGPAALEGWDRFTLASGAERTWSITVPDGEVLLSGAAALTWHRIVTQTSPTTFTASLANLRLRLERSDGAGGWLLVDDSDSAVDNVEMLVLEAPPSPGVYRLRVSSAGPVSATGALAWSLRTERPTTVTTWAALHGLAGAAAAPDADPDGDGWANLAEYAFGLDPTAREPVSQPVQTAAPHQDEAGTHAEIVYTRRRLATDLTYTVAAAPGPGGPWAPAAGTEVETTPINEDLEQVRWRAANPVTPATPTWLRVVVTALE